MFCFVHKKKGVALISTLSILVIVSLLGVYYVSSIRLHKLKNALFLNDARARLLARGGVHIALAHLKYGVDGARDNFCDSRLEDWYYTAGAGTDLGDAPALQTSFPGLAGLKENIDLGSNLIGMIYLKILDSASQINLNDSNPNLALILSHLPSLDAARANAIIAYRNSLAGGAFSFEEELLNVPGITPAIFNAIKDHVTLYSWSDPKATTSYNVADYTTTVSGGQSRSPVNVNTASQAVLTAVLQPLVPAEAASVASQIVAHVETSPFYSWQAFNTFIDGLGLAQSKANAIKNNANPNRIKPAGYTTEFCFHGGGYYEVESLARIERPNGTVLSRQSVKAGLKIFDIAQHTLKNDFRDEDTNNDGDHTDSFYGEGNFDTTFENGVARVDNTNYEKTTWLDSCPVNEADDQNWQGYSGTDPNEITPPGFPYRIIPNAVKLGFWDNFDEDQATNQSRAWWGNEMNYNMQISDVGSGFNYTYNASDYSDNDIFPPAGQEARPASFDGTEPTVNKLHTYDDVSSGSNAFFLDDADNELWAHGSGDPLNMITTQDFSKFYLGARGINLGGNPVIDTHFNRWDPADGFYFRVFNYDGPRSNNGRDTNFPGYRWQDLSDPTFVPDPPGRDRLDVGRVELFGINGWLQFYINPIGNIYNPAGAVKWGDFWAVSGSGFFAMSGGMAWSDAHRFQRDKVYKLGCFFSSGAERAHYYVYASQFFAAENEHSRRYTFNANMRGRIQLYSNAGQAAWDDVRIIDNDGRFAKHFVAPDNIDFGAFHANVTTPANTEVYYVGSTIGGNRYAGANLIDLSLASQTGNFLQSSGPYFPDQPVMTLGAGARIIEGPSAAGSKVFSYSFRMTTRITGMTPVVPAIEDVSISYLPATEILYCYET
jgi:DNA uptake protein ComE-like DNA-binding protein